MIYLVISLATGRVFGRFPQQQRRFRADARVKEQFVGDLFLRS